MNSWFNLTIKVFLGLCITSTIPCIGKNAPMAASQAAMQDADMRQLEAELAAFQRELDAMPEKERESFYKSMEEATKRIDDMARTPEGKELFERLERGELNEDEINKLLDDLVAPSSGQPMQIEPEPEIQKVQEKEKPKVAKPAMTSEQQRAITDITELIAATNVFMVKATTITDLHGMFTRWQKKRKVTVEASLTWDQFKTKIEQFITQLEHLLQQNPKTKTYSHIDALIKNQSLLNNLNSVKNTVIENNVKIEPTSPLQRKISSESKTALQKNINKYEEALTILGLIDEIKKVLGIFEPEAKKLQEEEEKARKKAEQESKKPRRPGKAITVGSSDEGYSGYAPSDAYGDYGYTPYTPSTDYGSSYPSYDYGSSSYSSPGSGFSSGSGTSGGKSADKDSKEKDSNKDSKERDILNKNVDEKDKKSDDKSLSANDKSKKNEVSDVEEPKEIKDLMGKINTYLSDAVQIVKDNSFFSDIENQVKGGTPPNTDFLLTELVDLHKYLSSRKGTLDAISTLHKKIRPEYRKVYQEKLEKIYDKCDKDFTKVTKAIDKLEDEYESLQNSLPDEQLWAYFGYEKPQAVPGPSPLDSIKVLMPHPISLFTVRDNIKAVKDKIDHFTQVVKKSKKG